MVTGVWLLFAGGTMCPADGQQKDDKKVRRKTSQKEVTDKEPKNITVDHNKVVFFVEVVCCLVFWGCLV